MAQALLVGRMGDIVEQPDKKAEIEEKALKLGISATHRLAILANICLFYNYLPVF